MVSDVKVDYLQFVHFKKNSEFIKSTFFIPIVYDCFKIMGDRYNIHSQLEHLQSKYIGTGHADTSRWEWATNQHRDSYALYMGHHDMLSYFALAENERRARVKFNYLERMIQPCGPPPERMEMDD